jgi:hypothetical protein
LLLWLLHPQKVPEAGDKGFEYHPRRHGAVTGTQQKRTANFTAAI